MMPFLLKLQKILTDGKEKANTKARNLGTAEYETCNAQAYWEQRCLFSYFPA